MEPSFVYRASSRSISIPGPRGASDLMAVHVALLRGINVGGKNMIKMPALKACFEAGGFEDVVTYIQSGNVLFRGTGSSATLATQIEKMLNKTFDHYKASVVVRSQRQMRTLVEKA